MDQAQVQAMIDAAVAAAAVNFRQELMVAENNLVNAQNQINILTANQAAARPATSSTSNICLHPWNVRTGSSIIKLLNHKWCQDSTSCHREVDCRIQS